MLASKLDIHIKDSTLGKGWYKFYTNQPADTEDSRLAQEVYLDNPNATEVRISRTYGFDNGTLP